MENLDLYNKVRAVPKEALKAIMGGKLKGKSDINPMWRIKALTENFGPCGKGWKFEIVKTWTDDGAGGEKVVNVLINLFVKFDGDTEWSEPILGIGGNTITQLEKGQLVTNDEAYKMALTDAISVACKSLGFAADVYFEQDKTKYGTLGQNNEGAGTPPQHSGQRGAQGGQRAPQGIKLNAKPPYLTGAMLKALGCTDIIATSEWIFNKCGKQLADLSKEEAEKVVQLLEAKAKKAGS